MLVVFLSHAHVGGHGREGGVWTWNSQLSGIFVAAICYLDHVAPVRVYGTSFLQLVQ